MSFESLKSFTLALLSLAAAGCEVTGGETPVVAPSREVFGSVSAVLERRCGTLDCHGDAARPMRIYGQTGLRMPNPNFDEIANPDAYVSGGEEPTTESEKDSNYRSVCALEPELLAKVVGGESAPEALTLVRKPRLLEKHKGGKIWDETGDGDRCLVAWLTNAPDAEACEAELAHR